MAHLEIDLFSSQSQPESFDGHSLQFTKQEPLDLVHGILLSHHRSVALRPWNHKSTNLLFTRGLLWLYTAAGMCVCRRCALCVPWTCVSSFALYSWLLMASSTPYPDRYTLLPLGFWRKQSKKVRGRSCTSQVLKILEVPRCTTCFVNVIMKFKKGPDGSIWWQRHSQWTQQCFQSLLWLLKESVNVFVYIFFCVVKH